MAALNELVKVVFLKNNMLTIKEKNKEEKIQTYPCLGVYKGGSKIHQGMKILFWREFYGTVVESKRNHTIGQVNGGYSMEDFDLFDVEICY